MKSNQLALLLLVLFVGCVHGGSLVCDFSQAETAVYLQSGGKLVVALTMALSRTSSNTYEGDIDVAAGSYNLLVFSRNKDGTTIATGSALCDISAGQQASCSILLEKEEICRQEYELMIDPVIRAVQPTIGIADVGERYVMLVAVLSSPLNTTGVAVKARWDFGNGTQTLTFPCDTLYCFVVVPAPTFGSKNRNDVIFLQACNPDGCHGNVSVNVAFHPLEDKNTSGLYFNHETLIFDIPRKAGYNSSDLWYFNFGAKRGLVSNEEITDPTSTDQSSVPSSTSLPIVIDPDTPSPSSSGMDVDSRAVIVMVLIGSVVVVISAAVIVTIIVRRILNKKSTQIVVSFA